MGTLKKILITSLCGALFFGGYHLGKGAETEAERTETNGRKIAANCEDPYALRYEIVQNAKGDYGVLIKGEEQFKIYRGVHAGETAHRLKGLNGELKTELDKFYEQVKEGMQKTYENFRRD